MKLSLLFQLSLLELSAAYGHYPLHYARRSSLCDSSTLNHTVGTYLVKEGESISTISSTVGRGICDIARLNRMADAMLPLTVAEELLIPPEVCEPDNSTCLIVPEPNATYATCVQGGPHTYYTLKGDTLRYIALKLNLTVDALMATAQGNLTDPDAPVPVDNFLKIPQCHPSRCLVWPETFTYGTYKDIAMKVGSTPGQIMAMNPTYNHTDVAHGEGAVITVISDCKSIGPNITVVS
ncbi:hypothetical protein N7462_006288 [Penicillium macrosclerotiorum]|uniref:uncharacterized protein n=1 Tax=Penicillium macrosclerotiorum TaxID=303699 RepID=UPI002549B2C1|nr:uncharacterized protein N7462_006288 [Penicillium macrosclerotiorum]KAJ5683123.1 hypothetical protein N7462_006288 [Penicillium macrosclerotiorum]